MTVAARSYPSEQRMLLLESYGKSILQQYGLATPRGYSVTNSAELEQAISELSFPVALKAQVPVGSRGKNGGILFASDRDEALAAMFELLGSRISNHQVDQILVEPRVEISAERYLAAMIFEEEVHIMACALGGVDIESTAAEEPGRIAIIKAPDDEGATSELASALEAAGFPSEMLPDYAAICLKLRRLMKANDAILVEINPLVETRTEDLVALDAKIDIDDAAVARQLAISSGIDSLLLKDQKKAHIPQIRPVIEGGSIGLIGLGGGLNLSIVDWFAAIGQPVAALTDIDDAIAADCITEFVRGCIIALRDDYGVSGVLINIISCNYALDHVARSILLALDSLPGQPVPVVLNIHGRLGLEANQILIEAGRGNAMNLALAVEQVISEVATR